MSQTCKITHGLKRRLQILFCLSEARCLWIRGLVTHFCDSGFDSVGPQAAVYRREVIIRSDPMKKRSQVLCATRRCRTEARIIVLILWLCVHVSSFSVFFAVIWKREWRDFFGVLWWGLREFWGSGELFYYGCLIVKRWLPVLDNAQALLKKIRSCDFMHLICRVKRMFWILELVVTLFIWVMKLRLVYSKCMKQIKKLYLIR